LDVFGAQGRSNDVVVPLGIVTQQVFRPARLLLAVVKKNGSELYSIDASLELLERS